MPKWVGFVASSPRNIDKAISVRVLDGHSSVSYSMALGGADFRKVIVISFLVAKEFQPARKTDS